MVPEFACTIVGFVMLREVNECRDTSDIDVDLTYYTALVMLILSCIFFFILLLVFLIYVAAYYSWVKWREWEEEIEHEHEQKKVNKPIEILA